MKMFFIMELLLLPVCRNCLNSESLIAPAAMQPQQVSFSLYLLFAKKKQSQRSPFPKRGKTNGFGCLILNEVGGCLAENMWREQEGLDPEFIQ